MLHRLESVRPLRIPINYPLISSSFIYYSLEATMEKMRN